MRKCIPLPGSSDHDMVLAVADIRAKLNRPVKRKLYLWKKKTDFEEIRDVMRIFQDDYMQRTTVDTPVET